jgi:hypothetical protein
MLDNGRALSTGELLGASSSYPQKLLAGGIALVPEITRLIPLGPKWIIRLAYTEMPHKYKTRTYRNTAPGPWLLLQQVSSGPFGARAVPVVPASANWGHSPVGQAPAGHGLGWVRPTGGQGTTFDRNPVIAFPKICRFR